MKLIDVLNQIAKGELKEGTEVKVGETSFFYRHDTLKNDNGYPLFTASYLPKNVLTIEVELIEPVCEHEWGDWAVRRVGGIIGCYKECEKCGKIRVIDHIDESDKKVEKIEELDVEFENIYKGFKDGDAQVVADVVTAILKTRTKLNEVIRDLNRRGK